MGIFEIFVIDDEVRHMINKRTSTLTLRNEPANWECAPCAKMACARCWPA